MCEKVLMNFLDPKLSGSCKISSDGVEDDYYCLDNLISMDASKRRLGFMAFSVSKPPIEITIKFEWKINLKVIKIYSVLSSQKSTKFQVFVQCKNFEGNEILRKIGDISLKDDQCGFCLIADSRNFPQDEALQVDAIYPYARKSVQSIDLIKIVIQDTKLRRAPVLNKIDILGYPSRDNSNDQIETISRLWEGKGLTPENTQPNIRTTGEVTTPERVAGTSSSFNVPEEFLDSITQELLVMPFILPSGNVVDESTMEKHNRNEEAYGRLPSDPFTGVFYSSGHQPKFNDSLKARLDEFKLRNCHELEVRQSGRTVGKKQAPVASSSGYSSNGHVSKKIKLTLNSNPGTSSNLDALISSIYKNNQISVFTKPRESKAVDDQWTCCKCQTQNILGCYRIEPCRHVFCKPCLLQLNSICGACQTTFQSKEVTKVNQ